MQGGAGVGGLKPIPPDLLSRILDLGKKDGRARRPSRGGSRGSEVPPEQDGPPAERTRGHRGGGTRGRPRAARRPSWSRGSRRTGGGRAQPAPRSWGHSSSPPNQTRSEHQKSSKREHPNITSHHHPTIQSGPKGARTGEEGEPTTVAGLVAYESQYALIPSTWVGHESTLAPTGHRCGPTLTLGLGCGDVAAGLGPAPSCSLGVHRASGPADPRSGPAFPGPGVT